MRRTAQKAKSWPAPQPLWLGIYEVGENKKKHTKYHLNLESLCDYSSQIHFFWFKKIKIKWGCEMGSSPVKSSSICEQKAVN